MSYIILFIRVMSMFVPTYLTSKSVVFKLFDSRPNFLTVGTFFETHFSFISKKKGGGELLIPPKLSV